MTSGPERITSKLDAQFHSISFLNRVLLFQLGKDGLEIKKFILSRYSFNDIIDSEETFRDSIFNHQILRLATQIILHEMLWARVKSYMPLGTFYSEKDLKKLTKFFKNWRYSE